MIAPMADGGQHSFQLVLLIAATEAATEAATVAVAGRGGHRDQQQGHLLGLSSVNDAFPGTVTVIQSFDSALRLKVHMHTLALDGVYVKRADGEGITFLRLPSLTDDEVHEVAERTAKRVATLLHNRGRTLDGLSAGDDVETALGACYEAVARTPKTRVVDARRLRSDERVAVVAGFNVHAGPSIAGRDRKRVERVCRYLTRPPIATERLTQIDGALHYERKKVWRDGTRFVTLAPYDPLARVCAMVPLPRFHMVRFHGVLAPNAALREQVVSSARPSPTTWCAVKTRQWTLGGGVSKECVTRIA